MEKKTKIKHKLHVLDIIVLVLLIVFTFSLLFILAWGLLTSFKSLYDFQYEGNNFFGLPNLEIKGATVALAFGNYRRILFGTAFNIPVKDTGYYSSIFGYVERSLNFTKFTFAHYLLNSFIYSFVCSFVHAFVAFTCAFLCAKYKFRFSEFVYVLMLVIMAVPIVGSSPSMIELLRDLAIHDTIFAMVALNFNFTGMYFFVFHAHLSGVSNTYMEAAEIDGASQLGIFLRIIFPLCAKVFFTVFLLQFIQTWNDYQTVWLYYPNHPTLAYAVWAMSRNTNVTAQDKAIPQRVAGCMILAIPVFVVFVAFNKLLMGNLTMGGLKE